MLDIHRILANHLGHGREMVSRRRRSRYTWDLEVLEGRALLSTFTVLNNADHGPGSLRDTLAEAPPGSTIDFAPGLSGEWIDLTTGELQIDKDLAIIGLGSANLTVDTARAGGVGGRVFNITNSSSTVTIAGLTLGYSSSDEGGVVYNTGADLNLIDCSLSTGYAHQGGGLYNKGGTVNLNDCDIVSNTASASGGGGFYNDDGTINVSGGVLGWNRSLDSSGGGFYTNGGTVSLNDCTITTNSVDNHIYTYMTPTGGGGFYNQGGTVVLSGCTIAGNSVVGETSSEYISPPPVDAAGGGIYGSGGSLTISGCDLSGNLAQGSAGLDGDAQQYVPPGGNAYGGGIYMTSGSLRVSTSTLEGNTATGGSAGGQPGAPQAFGGDASGAGLYLQGVDASITDSTISGNIATGGHGENASPVVATGTHSPFIFAIGTPGGKATGGGIYFGSGSLQLDNSTVSGNQASGGDGGDVLSGVDPTSFTLSWVLLGGKGGDSIGGGLFVGGGSVNIVGNTFSANASSGGLGAAGAVSPDYPPGYWDPNGPDGLGTGGAIGGSMTLLQNNDFAGNGASTSGPDADAFMPLFVSQFTVDHRGRSQRSNIESVSVQFNQDADMQSLIDSGTITSAVQIVSAGGALPLTADRYHYDATSYTLTIDLTVRGGSHKTRLSDGRYQLQLDTAQVKASGNSVNHLNLQDTAPSPDGRVRYDFFRLLGDLNGDGVVNSADLVIERNQIIGYAGAVPTTYGDLNGDGVVDLNDFLALRKMLGKKLP
jgi:hypothetical protein